MAVQAVEDMARVASAACLLATTLQCSTAHRLPAALAQLPHCVQRSSCATSAAAADAPESTTYAPGSASSSAQPDQQQQSGSHPVITADEVRRSGTADQAQLDHPGRAAAARAPHRARRHDAEPAGGEKGYFVCMSNLGNGIMRDDILDFMASAGVHRSARDVMPHYDAPHSALSALIVLRPLCHGSFASLSRQHGAAARAVASSGLHPAHDAPCLLPSCAFLMSKCS